MTEHINWAGQSSIITIRKPTKQKMTWGHVRLKDGRVIWRNYRRELKNGKGLSFLDVLNSYVNSSVGELIKRMKEDFFGDNASVQKVGLAKYHKQGKKK